MIFEYDASGAKTRQQFISGSGGESYTLKYGLGFVVKDDVLQEYGTEVGRILYDDNPNGEYEYAIEDHLGNTRITFIDKNGDGTISLEDADGEITSERHYYPFGLEMDGDWYGQATQNLDRYGYNGIEYSDDADLQTNFAFYRSLDPGLGRWWQIDPKAEALYGLSPYNAMGNNPVLHTDPNGDILPAILIGAAIGVATNGIGNAMNGQGFFEGAGKAALFGAVGGAISAGIGGIASNMLANGASQFGVAAFQAGAHGLSGGLMSAAQGGNFWHGAAAGGFSSGVGSGIGALGGGDFAQWLGGGLSGGFGSSIAGGSFWQGAGQGLITGGLNHAAHELAQNLTEARYNGLVRKEKYIRALEFLTSRFQIGASLDIDGLYEYKIVEYSEALVTRGPACGVQTITIGKNAFNIGYVRMSHFLEHEYVHVHQRAMLGDVRMGTHHARREFLAFHHNIHNSSHLPSTNMTKFVLGLNNYYNKMSSADQAKYKNYLLK